MRKLNPLIKLLPLAAAVLIGLPDVALAQSGGFNFQNGQTIDISGPGLSTSLNVVVTPNTGAVTSLVINTPAVQGGGTWLCANNTSNIATINVNIGSASGCGSTAGLVANQSYNGQVPFTVNGTPQILNLILRVGTTQTGVGLSASPNPLTFNVAVGSGATSSNVSIFNSGVLTALSSVSATTTTGQAWLQPFITGSTGIVTVNVNPTILSAGSYTGTVFVTATTGGSLSFTVNLNVGTGGSTFGLSANPNPVTFNTSFGSASQNVFITYNGSATTVTSLSSFTNTGQQWLQTSNTGISGTILVTVNPSALTSGSDTGTVSVTTTQGPISFQVTLITNGTGAGTLVANPNPINVNVPFGSGTSSQNVTVTSNGSPIFITQVSSTTANGQAWLQTTNTGNTGVLAVTFNASLLNFGSYTGSIFVTTTAGSLTIPVTLTVGGSTNAAGLVATPNPVNFNIPLIGSGTAPQNVNITLNGVAVQITGIVVSTVGQNWLLAGSSATGVLSLSINGANLTAGTYSGTVALTTSGGSINVPVNLNVGGGGTTGLSVTPNPVFLNVPVGGGQTSQNVTVTYNGSPASITNVTASTTTGQTWLQAIASGTGTITVTANPFALQAGSYSGTVAITTTLGQVNLQVSLNVGSGGSSSGLSASPNPVTLTASSGGSVTSQNVSITANGLPVTIIGISSTTSSGSNWLQPFTSGGAGTVTVNANASALQAGSYSGTVTVTATVGTTTFQVNLTVGGVTGVAGVIASPNPVAFTESAVGQAGSQTISASLNGVPQAVTAATFAPVQIGLTFVNTQINPDGTVTLTVNGVVTTPGFYQGNLTLFTNGGNVTVPVTLQFGSSGGGAGLAANPNPVNFGVQPGGAVPSQNVNVTFNGFAVAVTGVGASTTTGQNWLLPSLSTTPGGVTVNVNALGLVSGSYIGTVTVTTTSGTLTFQVNLVVGSGGGGPPAGPTVVVSPVVLNSVSYQIGGAAPLPQTISISMNGGGTLGFTATGTTSSGGSWLGVTPASGSTPGSVTVSINTAALTTPGSYQGTVVIAVAGASNSPVTVPVNLTVTAPAVTTPSVVAVQNAASTLPTSLSPGLNIVIFGSNMGPATLATFAIGPNGALATTVSGTQVTFDGVPAAIVYTSNNQVSVMVPYAVANRATTSLVVTYNGVSSTPVSFRVVDTAPGIYTINQSGSGQGAILNQNGSVNSPGNAEIAGNIIQIFATGEGQTSPGGSDGALTPNRLPTPTPTLPVTVTIGGIAVPASDIFFAGEAPGLISGVIQVNAKIPQGVGTGPVSVVIRVGGVASQANVTVSVR